MGVCVCVCVYLHMCDKFKKVYGRKPRMIWFQ